MLYGELFSEGEMNAVKIWAGFVPLLSALALFHGATATKFDSNEIETLGATAALLRFGTLLLGNKHIRNIARDFLDSFEKNETDGTP